MQDNTATIIMPTGKKVLAHDVVNVRPARSGRLSTNDCIGTKEDCRYYEVKKRRKFKDLYRR